MEEMRLQGNNFNGTIPAPTPFLPSCRFLFLSSNELEGTVPAAIATPNLVRLYVDKNRFSQRPGLVRLTGVSVYSRVHSPNSLLSDNVGLSGTLPSSLSDLGSLDTLMVSNTALSGTLPEITSLGLVTL